MHKAINNLHSHCFSIEKLYFELWLTHRNKKYKSLLASNLLLILKTAEMGISSMCLRSVSKTKLDFFNIFLQLEFVIFKTGSKLQSVDLFENNMMTVTISSACITRVLLIENGLLVFLCSSFRPPSLSFSQLSRLQLLKKNNTHTRSVRIYCSNESSTELPISRVEKKQNREFLGFFL